MSELLQELTPEDRAEVDRIKAEMQREEDRLVASGLAGPRAGSESRNRPDEAVTERSAPLGQPGAVAADGRPTR